MSQQERATIAAGIIRNSKVIACFSVVAVGFSTWALSAYPSWWADALTILLWFANYVTITSMLGANQRLLLIHDLIAAGDWEGVRRFSAVPHDQHVKALLIFDNPDKLYRSK